MQTKIDKDYLIKNRFWVSLPAIGLFLLIGFFCVIGVRGTADAFFKKAEARNNDLERIKKDQELRNSKWIAAIDVERQAAVDQMTAVWTQEFDRQNGVIHDAEGRKIRDPLITWPAAIETVPPVGKFRRPLKDHDFGEPVGTNPPYFNELPPEYESSYKEQFNDIRKLLDLMDERTGSGSVRVIGGSKSHWDNALDLLRPHALTPNRRVLSDEAWLLQEDVAIKRELFKAIASANNLVADLQPEWRLLTSLPEQLKSAATGGDSAPPGGAVASPGANVAQPATPAAGEKSDKPDDAKKGTAIDHQRFLNSTWQVGLLELTIKDGKEVTAPHTRWWEGWFLDVELAKMDNNEFALNGYVANFGYLHKVPGAKVAIVLQDEFAQPKDYSVIVDLPELAKSTEEATNKLYQAQANGTLDFTSLATMPVTKQSLKVDLKGKLPDRFHPKRIVQVRRAPPTGSGKPDDRSKVFDHQRFANDFWVFDVQLVSGGTGFNRGLQGVLYNHSGRRLTAPKFEVTVSDKENSENDRTQTVAVWGDKLNALNARGEGTEETRDRRSFPRPGSGPIKIDRQFQYKEIVSVRQVLDWQTVPVKRIDRLELGTDAHKENDRVKVVGLKKYDFTRKSTVPVPQEAAPPEAGGGVPGAGPSAMGPGGGGGGMAPGMNPSGLGGRQEDAVTANHKVHKYRYYETEAEVRRVPVALVLIVDANHIADVLTAFANTRLRVQVTQAVWTRLPQGIGRPSTPVPSDQAGAGGSASKRETAGGPSMAGGGFKGGGMGAGAAAGPAAKPDEETLQVELQIYGLATIYEDPEADARIKKEREASTTPATPTPPTTPAK